MISGEEEVLFKYEDETRYFDWRRAQAWLEPETGEVVVRAVGGHPFTVSMPVVEVSACEIELEGERSLLGSIMMTGLDHTYGGEVGCWTALLFSPIGIIDYFRNRGVQIPVLKLTQSLPDESGQMQEVVLRLRSKRRGRRGQEETRALADRVGAYLREHGYDGLLPDPGPGRDTTE
jgi:hypothetical protein